MATPAGAPEGLMFVEATPEQGPAVPRVVPGYVNFYVSPPPAAELPVGQPGQAMRIHETSSRLRPGEVERFYPGVLHEYLELGYTVTDFRVGRRERSASLIHPTGPRVLQRVFSDAEHVDLDNDGYVV